MVFSVTSTGRASASQHWPSHCAVLDGHSSSSGSSGKTA